MGKYTVETLPKLDARIDKDMETIVNRIKQLTDAHLFTGAVLLGGYGRGEGTPFKINEERTPFNDYDLVVVAHPMPYWRHQQLQKQLHQLETSLEEQLGIAVELYLHTTDTLRKSNPSLMNVEMKLGHRVVFGDKNLLSPMPEYTLADIPLDEGTRLLFNRGRLLLEVEQTLARGTKLDDVRLNKFLLKVHLALGDCTLLAYKAYDLYYANKAQRIASICSSAEIPHKEWVLTAYQRAVAFKLSGDPVLLFNENLQDSCAKTRQVYLAFFLWYEGLRLGQPLASVEEYRELLVKCPERGKQRVKAMLLNLWLLHHRAFRPKPSWIWLYPRKRLYIALLLLLRENPFPADLQDLLGTDAVDNQLLQTFKSLARRLE